VWENDAHRVRVAFASYAALGVLQLVALVRFPDVVSFSGPKPWIYVLFLISLLVVGLYGWLVLRR
jgi:H+/Cl- antiporter ClcA